MASRLRAWWAWSPTDRYVVPPDHPDVVRLAEQIAPGSGRSPLGGWTSLNVHLHSSGLVLRVHPRYITRRRAVALRTLRRVLLDNGLRAAEPRQWNGRELFRCRDRIAELEEFVPHDTPDESWDAYRWLYTGMGRLHRVLASADFDLPRPVDSIWAPPSTLRRWISVAEPTVRNDPRAYEALRHMKRLIATLRAQWIPATALPNQPIHGDFHLGNIGRAESTDMLYLDFGCAARRPRIHDLASSLAGILRTHQDREPLDTFAWQLLPDLIEAYENGAHTTLDPLELAALGPYLATVPLYLAGMAGYLDDPVEHLHNQERLDFLNVADWILTHSDYVRRVLKL